MHRPLVWSGFLSCAALGLWSPGAAAEKHVAIATCAQIDPSYRRKTNRDGSFQVEYYAISYGGKAEGTTTDDSIDQVDFRSFAGLIERHLATQNFRLAPNAKSAELLLYVNWGRTLTYNELNYGFSVTQAGQAARALQSLGVTATDPAVSPQQLAAAEELENALLMVKLENRARDLATEPNARLLGYIDDINANDTIARLVGGGARYDELRGDIEASRYYLVIFAYDFRALTERNEKKIRWVTRISIHAQGQRFDQNLAAMVERAARYAGRDSGGLMRDFKGTVEAGDTEVIGVVEGDDAPATPEPTSAR